MEMPIFKGLLNAYPLANLLANGPPDDLPSIRKKAVCVSKRHAIHFRVRGYPALGSGSVSAAVLGDRNSFGIMVTVFGMLNRPGLLQ
jgi:hypothetical protein